MTRRDHALKQIEEINEVMRNSLTINLPGGLLVGVGLGLLAVPFCEMFFSQSVDQWIQPKVLIFILRTVFYWVAFALISRLFAKREDIVHPAIKKAWALNPYFPLVPLATSAVLALTGYSALIGPIVSILVGLYFSLIGRFSQCAFSVLAAVYIVIGLVGIYVATMGIDNSWYGILWLQGASCIVTGMILRAQQS